MLHVENYSLMTNDGSLLMTSVLLKVVYQSSAAVSFGKFVCEMPVPFTLNNANMRSQVLQTAVSTEGKIWIK